jgi:hypothetical protein
MVIEIKIFTFFEKLDWAIRMQQDCKKISGKIMNVEFEHEQGRLRLTIQEDGEERQEFYLRECDAATFFMINLRFYSGNAKIVAYYSTESNRSYISYLTPY